MQENRMSLVTIAQRITLAVALLGAGVVSAQTVYRIVGPDGKVTFSDKPPASAEQGKVQATGVGAAAVAAGSVLPTELRQATAKFPVTLYTAPDCGPCGSGRNILTTRGIPFNERTVTNAEDLASLQRISGQGSLPFLTIGTQKITGFSSEEWTQYLDAAGYPKSSQLPAGFRNAPAAPLVAVQQPTPKQEDKSEAKPAPAKAAENSNPAGIQF
jgi:glutaredoxin